MWKYRLISTLFCFVLVFAGCSKEPGVPSSKVKDKHVVTINSIETLSAFMKDGQEKGYFPKKIVNSSHFSHIKKLQTVDLNFRTTINWNKNSKCSSRENQIIIALGSENRSVTCHTGDTALLLGGGNDWVKDSTGNDIFYPGEGNDTIKSSSGSDIFIFEPNWGHDKIEISSFGVNKNYIDGYDGVSYPWEYSSFIIFGKGVHRSDIRWKGKKLVNIKTNDSIEVNTRSVNLLFAEEADSKIVNNFVPEIYIPQETTLYDLNAESVLIKDKYGYFAKGNDGLYIADLHQTLQPKITSKTSIPGRAMSVNVVDNIAYVAQGQEALEGKRGWVSIIDVTDPTKPITLHTLAFDNTIFSLEVKDDKLYIPSTDFFDKSKRHLYIYDVSSKKTPSLLSKTKLSYFSKFILVMDNMLYLSSFQSGFSIYDISDEKNPKYLSRDKHENYIDWSIKSSQDKIVVNHSDNLITVYKSNKNKKPIHVCEVFTTDQKHVAGLAKKDSIAVHKNHLFRAEGKLGVTITNINECNVVKTIPFENYWVSSIYVVDDILVAFNEREKSKLYSLSQGKLLKEEALVKINPKVIANKKNYKSMSQDQLQTLLYKAASNGDVKAIHELCKAGANPNEPGHQNYSPFGISVRLMQLDSMEALLENGAKSKDKHMIEAARNDENAMKLLEKYGGNITATDRQGCPTLFFLATHGTVDMVHRLVEKGISPKTICYGKLTVLDRAKQGDNKKVISYLKKAMSTEEINLKKSNSTKTQRTLCKENNGIYDWDGSKNRWLCSKKVTKNTICEINGGTYEWDKNQNSGTCLIKRVKSQREVCEEKGNKYIWNGKKNHWVCTQPST